VAVVRVTESHLAASRAAVAGWFAGLRLSPDEASTVGRLLSPQEVRVAVATPGWATRAGDAFSFDWERLERALKRELTPLDLRALRQAATSAPADPVVERLAAAASAVDEALGG